MQSLRISLSVIQFFRLIYTDVDSTSKIRRKSCALISIQVAALYTGTVRFVRRRPTIDQLVKQNIFYYAYYRIRFLSSRFLTPTSRKPFAPTNWRYRVNICGTLQYKYNNIMVATTVAYCLNGQCITIRKKKNAQVKTKNDIIY